VRGREEEEEEEEVKNVDTEFTVVCPCRKFPEINCMWNGGDLVDLQDHVEAVHTDVLMPGPWFRCESLTNTVLLVRCFDELFLYYKYFSESGLMYTFVQQIGVTSKNFRYAVTLFSHNELMGDIKYSFGMTKISESFETIINEDRCMAIDIRSLEYFRFDNRIQMCIRIEKSDVTERKDEERRIPRTKPQEQEVKLSDETVKCPLLKIPDFTCSWSGKTTLVKLHLLTEHRNIHTAFTEFKCQGLHTRVLLILFNGEIFLYYKHISYDSMYVTVQQLDFTNEKYAFRIELLAKNVQNNISFTSDVKSYKVPFLAVFNTPNCLSKALDGLKPFKRKSKLNMKVRLTRVQTQQETS
jgi:hypothetical protein